MKKIAHCAVILFFVSLLGCGYESSVVLRVQKDWAIDSPNYNPDLRTEAEIRFDKNKNRSWE